MQGRPRQPTGEWYVREETSRPDRRRSARAARNGTSACRRDERDAQLTGRIDRQVPGRAGGGARQGERTDARRKRRRRRTVLRRGAVRGAGVSRRGDPI